MSGPNLMIMLETRLDNVIFRLVLQEPEEKQDRSLIINLYW